MDLTRVKDLNPCSKCGSAPEFTIERDSIGTVKYIQVYCKKCCTALNRYPGSMDGGYVNEIIKELIHKWNKENPKISYTIPELYPTTKSFISSATKNTWTRMCEQYLKDKKENKNMANTFFGYGGYHLDPVKRAFEIDKVIFNDPATIVFWKDGTKTVVKAVNEPFDPEKGLAMAIAKKALGNQGNYYNVFKKYIITEEEMKAADEAFESGELERTVREIKKAVEEAAAYLPKDPLDDSEYLEKRRQELRESIEERMRDKREGSFA